MKQVYVAYFRRGLGGPAKVLGDDEADAKKAAFAALRYHSDPYMPYAKIDDVVDRVELDPDQILGGAMSVREAQIVRRRPRRRPVQTPGESAAPAQESVV